MGIKRIVLCGMILALLVVGTACSRSSSGQIGRNDVTEGKDGETVRVSENIPDTLEKIPDEYKTPAQAQAQGHDGIASWSTMKNRLERLENMGISTEFHSYEGLSHGFGIGTGTVAEGWINDAVKFWEKK